jgi:hypothetical protein
VIVGAVDALHRCDAAERNGEATEATKAARILALSVVESFSSLREYLREVTRCMERVDPHLCNNLGLVTKLVDWEEKWEIGKNYVRHDSVLAAVCGVVAQIRVAQQLEPTLATLCNERDVELFLILPRIMWLCFLEAPEKYSILMQMLLPPHFEQCEDIDGGSPASFTPSADLSILVDSHRSLKEILLSSWPVPRVPELPQSDPRASPSPARSRAPLSSPKGPLQVSSKLRQRTPRLLTNMRASSRQPEACPPSSSSASLEPPEAQTPEEAIWDLLLRRAVSSEDQTSVVRDELLPRCEGLERAQTALEDLMKDLERWGIQLQRHCPDDYNQCCAILLQCLAGECGNQHSSGSFHV